MCGTIVREDFFILLFMLAKLALSTQDMTTPRANTLFDDADDLQKQLDNEAKDRMKNGRPTAIWVFHFPTQFPDLIGANAVTHSTPQLQEPIKKSAKREYFEACPDPCLCIGNTDWSYKDQNNWHKTYPDCGGRSQSPVDLPYKSLINSKTGRKLLFQNYDETPLALTLQNDGKTVTLRGKWKKDRQPYICGGAAFNRKYIFHSITLHWPSEHAVGSLLYPMESQVLHIAAEYKSYEHALNASASDPLAFLGVANLYMFGKTTQKGLAQLLEVARCKTYPCHNDEAQPLKYYNPPFTEYACYHGSLTFPPCKESVLWLVRARALVITREAAERARDLLGTPGQQGMFFRTIQPLNDRRTYYFKN